MLEQTGTAKKLTGQILENWLVSYADGHGGIQSLVKTSSTGTDPVIDTYTITYADTTTSTFTVTNGLKGDKGDQTYLWIKYASRYPEADSDMSGSPDDWIGVYSGTSSTAPTHYTDYTWFEWKGETGNPAILQTNAVAYQVSNNGTTVPTGTWSATVPYVTPGDFLWTQVILTWNNGNPVTYYTVSRYGVDGVGAAGTSIPLPDSVDGAVGTSMSFSREDHVHPTDTSRASADALNRAVLQATVQTISGNGTTSGITLTGLTAGHVVANWGMFSDAACTIPIPENSPTCDITITTAADAWSVTVANFSATFYLRPTFILKQN